MRGYIRFVLRPVLPSLALALLLVFIVLSGHAHADTTTTVISVPTDPFGLLPLIQGTKLMWIMPYLSVLWALCKFIDGAFKQPAPGSKWIIFRQIIHILAFKFGNAHQPVPSIKTLFQPKPAPSN